VCVIDDAVSFPPVPLETAAAKLSGAATAVNPASEDGTPAETVAVIAVAAGTEADASIVDSPDDFASGRLAVPEVESATWSEPFVSLSVTEMTFAKSSFAFVLFDESAEAFKGAGAAAAIAGFSGFSGPSAEAAVPARGLRGAFDGRIVSTDVA
jgi:hypothetical protein